MDLNLPKYLIEFIAPMADAKGVSQQAIIKAILRDLYEQHKQQQQQ